MEINGDGRLYTSDGMIRGALSKEVTVKLRLKGEEAASFGTIYGKQPVCAKA